MVDAAIEPQAETRDWEGRLELITAILLGLAAVATAWAAFQGSQYDGQMLTAFTDANLNLSDSNQYYSEGDQVYFNDQTLFIEYERALNEGEDEYANFVRESLMRDELVAAVEWWELPENMETYVSPFVEENPNYVIVEYDTADELSAETDAAYVAGQEANDTGDKYNLITVLLAASLFVLGIATSFKVLNMRIALIGLGALLLFGSLAWMLTLPTA